MKFKHTFHVFVDNFNITYKQLLYRLAVLVVAGIVFYFSVIPFINGFLPELNNLINNAGDFVLKLLNGEVSELTLKKLTPRLWIWFMRKRQILPW